MTRNDWRSNWKTSGDPVRWQWTMSQGRAQSSWIEAGGDKGRLKLEECGVMELLITSCQMMMFGRECFRFVPEWKRRTRRSWCCKILWRNLAEDWIRCNPGKALAWRQRWKTPPGSVLTAATRELAPKSTSWKQNMGHVMKETWHQTRPMGHSRHTKKEGGYPADSILTVPHHTPMSHRTVEKE